MDQLMNYVRGYSFGKMTYPNGGIFGPIQRPYFSLLQVIEGACTLSTTEGAVTIRAGKTGIAATNSRFSFDYHRNQPTTAIWCEGFLPQMSDEYFGKLNQSYEPVVTPERIRRLQEIGVETGHGSSPALNAMRDAIGLAVIRAFLFETQQSDEDLGLPKSILAARRIFKENLEDETLAIASVAQQIGITPQHMIASFKKHVGITPARYLWRLRVQRARAMLIHTRNSQAEIAYQCGYKSLSHFSRSIKMQFGMTPAELRRDMGFTQPSDLADNVPDVHF